MHTLSWFAAVWIPTALSDEFANPTHTPAIQILFPRRNSCTNDSFQLIFAAPIFAEVRIKLDNAEVALVSGATHVGEFSGVSEGNHMWV